MKISAINNRVNFGKIQVMKCSVNQKGSNSKKSATLYEMEPDNPKDVQEVRYSKNARCIYYDFMIDAGKKDRGRRYYMLKDDKTQEVIACAQTSRHIRPENSTYSGQNTLIEEMSENPKYVDGAKPLIAYIAHRADSEFDNFVSTAFDTDIIPYLKDFNFIQIPTGDWIIPKGQYGILEKHVKNNAEASFMN